MPHHLASVPGAVTFSSEASEDEGAVASSSIESQADRLAYALTYFKGLMEQAEAKLDSAKGAVAASVHKCELEQVAAQRAHEQAEVVVASVDAVMKRELAKAMAQLNAALV